MEYLTGKPFSVGGYNAIYGAGYDRIFRKKPIPSTRLTAAEGDDDGHEGALGEAPEELVSAEAQGAVLPVPPVEEARETPVPSAGDSCRT